MCLLTDILTPFVAEKDIPVYKIFNEKLKSVHKDFFYEFNKLYETDFTFVSNDEYWMVFDIIVAEHYLSKYSYGNKYNKCREKLLCIAEGFHSFLYKERIEEDEFKYNIILQCIIPKGASYYIDGTGLAVSNKIIVNDITCYYAIQ